MGDIFFRNGSPAEIELMGYRRLKYWAGWDEVYSKAERAVLES